MVEADFVTAVENAEYVLPSAKKVTPTNDNLGFENFKCSTIVADDHFSSGQLPRTPEDSDLSRRNVSKPTTMICSRLDL